MARQVWSNIKNMLILSFNKDGIIHHEFVLHNQTVNQRFYKGVLQCLSGSNDQENSNKSCQLWIKAQRFEDHLRLHRQGNDVICHPSSFP
jgi:hypothetical protein